MKALASWAQTDTNEALSSLDSGYMAIRGSTALAVRVSCDHMRMKQPVPEDFRTHLLLPTLTFCARRSGSDVFGGLHGTTRRCGNGAKNGLEFGF